MKYILLYVSKNELFTMKVKNARLIRKMLKDVKKEMRVASFEDVIVTMVRFLYPSIAIKYFPIKITPIIGGDDSGKRSSKRNSGRK